MSDAPDFAEACNAMLGGFNRGLGLRFTRASAEEVAAEWTVTPEQHQPYGIVHGGVLCGVIEALCSTGAALYALPRGQSVVGLDNHTSFLRAVRDGTLTATARPLSRGRRTQVWDGVIQDAQGRVIASGRVRLICLEAGAELAGETVGLKT